MLYDSTATATERETRLVGTIALKVTATCGFAKRWFTATGDGTQPAPLVAGDLVADTGGDPGGFVVERAATGRCGLALPDGGGDRVAADRGGRRADRRRLRRPSLRVRPKR